MILSFWRLIYYRHIGEFSFWRLIYYRHICWILIRPPPPPMFQMIRTGIGPILLKFWWHTGGARLVLLAPGASSWPPTLCLLWYWSEIISRSLLEGEPHKQTTSFASASQIMCVKRDMSLYLQNVWPCRTEFSQFWGWQMPHLKLSSRPSAGHFGCPMSHRTNRPSWGHLRFQKRK